MNPQRWNFSIWCQELLRKYKSNFYKGGILFLCKSPGKLIIWNRMVPRKHLQERRCRSLKHCIFQAACFLIRADSFVTAVIITQQWWVTGARIFPCFNHFFRADCGRGRCPLAVQCTLHNKWEISGSQGSACVDRTQYWESWHPAFQLSNEVNDRIY